MGWWQQPVAASVLVLAALEKVDVALLAAGGGVVVRCWVLARLFLSDGVVNVARAVDFPAPMLVQYLHHPSALLLTVVKATLEVHCCVH